MWQAAVADELGAVEASLDVLMHKARLAATIQANLESRAKALRSVLRNPSLWPCGARRPHARTHTRVHVAPLLHTPLTACSPTQISYF